MAQVTSLFVVDHDKKVFNIHENILDDQYHLELIILAQKDKRDVRYFTTYEPAFEARSELEAQGYQYTEERICE
ncbi:hypothetical protein O9H85_08315 [Paenibacillus filicis]|uniref:Uncharacterized protein n=1 Tax=Paenibacillus gyeongsangnamensis TaxID=3388067 RepID=A0ABT4Q6M7_9BACL|nr:hypothetical protein [Paenibacillus filicis]MCZ8512437.1 hypothetical protein [Paenibacillus filicis]